MKAFFQTSRSLRAKNIVMILLCMTCVMLLYVFYSFFTQRNFLLSGQKLRNVNVAERLVFTMNQPLWNYDRDYLLALINQELKTPEIFAVALLLHDSKLYLGKKRLNDNDSRVIDIISMDQLDDFKSVTTIDREITKDGKQLGKLILYTTDRFIRQELLRFLFYVIMQSLLILGTVSLLIYIGLQRMILSPLSNLSDAAKKLASGDLSARATQNSDDEIGRLVSTFNSMATAINEHSRKRDKLLDDLQESRGLQTALLENSFQFQGLLAPDGRLLEVNNTALEFIGAKRDAVVGMFFWETPWWLHDPAQQIRLQEAIMSAATGDFIRYEVVHIDVKGNRAIIDFSLKPVMDSGGHINYIIAEGRDITQRVIAEANLRKLSQAVEQSPVTIVITDTAGTIEYVNPKFSQLTGYSSEEAIGKNPSILKSGKTTAETYRQIWETITNGNVWQGELCNRGKAGQLFWESVCIAPIKTVDGTITHFVAVKEDISEKKRMQETLEQSEEKFAKAFHSFPAIVIISSLADGRFLEVNTSFVNTFGYSHEEVIGRTSLELELRPNPDERLDMLKRLKAFGRIEEVQYTFRKRSGEIVIGLFSGEIISLYGKKCLISMIKDVTAQRAAEKALRGKEAFLEKVSSCVPDLIWAFDLAGNFTYVNAAVKRTQGWTVEEFTKLNFRDVIVPEHIAMHEALIESELARAYSSDYDRNTVVRIESHELRKDGSTFWADVTAIFLWSDEGLPIGVIGSTRDITQRRKMEEELRDNEEKFRQIFAQSYDGVILIQLDNLSITTANQSFHDIFGFSREEISFIKPWDILPRKVFQQMIKAVQEDHESKDFLLEKSPAFRKDGPEIFVSLRSKVIRMKNEYFILLSIRDISDRLRLEDEIKLTHAKMIQTNKMTSLGMLVSGVAHEINNPNQCIAVNTSVLSNIWRDIAPIVEQHCAEGGVVTLGGLPSSETEELVPQLFSGIAESSQRINSIVANMKDYVRSGTGTKSESFAINRVITNATSLLWHNIQKYTDNFVQELDEDIPLVHGNAQQVEQVLINLIMNGLQSLPDKSHELKIVTAFDKTAGKVIVTVADDGKGMDRETLQRLAEPFFTTRGSEGGTGLGLYISTTIIKEYNGSLEFDSEPGKGTTATVRLPAVSNLSSS